MMAANSILESFLSTQGYALFEYTGNGVFYPIGEYPKWCQSLWKGALARDKSIRLAEASPLGGSECFPALIVTCAGARARSGARAV